MYTIISPPGIHGALGRKIQRQLENERTERCLNAKYRQLIVQDPVATNKASLIIDEHCAGNETRPKILESHELPDIIEELQSK
jgi:hypothetical protein